MTVDRVSGAALFLFALVVAWEDRVLPLGTHGVPGPGYLPLLLAAFLAILGLILFLRGGQAVPFRSVKWSEGLHAIAILVCCGLSTLAMERLGYRISMVIILAFLFGVMERLKWWLVLSLSAGLSFGSFWIFDTMLKVILPRGYGGF